MVLSNQSDICYDSQSIWAVMRFKIFKQNLYIKIAKFTCTNHNNIAQIM